MDDRMESAMGPDEQPGDAEPTPAKKSTGLGGMGTEGKPGAPEGGTEPQLPDETGQDISQERLRKVAEHIQREKFIQKQERQGSVENRTAGTPPPYAIPATGGERKLEAGPTSGESPRPDRPQVGEAYEGPPPDEENQDERARRSA
jgi:hypothetical protein